MIGWKLTLIFIIGTFGALLWTQGRIVEGTSAFLVMWLIILFDERRPRGSG